MIQEDKELLLRDLCARLPHKVIVEFVSYKGEEKPWIGELSCKDLDCFIHDVGFVEIKPYLFPISSLTEEQKKEYYNLCIEEEREQMEFGEWVTRVYYHNTIESIDWLTKNHFDYRSLIEKELAIDATGLNIY